LLLDSTAPRCVTHKTIASTGNKYFFENIFLMK
jgi:hypothetical protein